jgi:hypothetical protein
MCCGTTATTYLITAITILVNAVPAYLVNNGINIWIRIVAIDTATRGLGITVPIAIKAILTDKYIVIIIITIITAATTSAPAGCHQCE